MTAKDAVIKLAIDDGVTHRGHRNFMFKENFDSLGICEGKHKKFAEMTVLMFSGKAVGNEKDADHDKD